MSNYQGDTSVRGGRPHGLVRAPASPRMDVRARPRSGGGVGSGGSYGLVYGGGPVMECVYAYPVFVGSKWVDNETYVGLAAQLQLFLHDIFGSSFVSVLRQYGYLAGVFSAAHFEGAPSSLALDDAAVANIVAGLHPNVIPDDGTPSGQNLAAHVALVYLDDTVTFSDNLIGGSFCAPDLIYGYHWYNSTLRPVPFYYGIMACLSDACVSGDPNMTAMTQLQRLTVVTSHELAEMVSDAQPWSGWNSPYGEIGDLCEGSDASFMTSYPDGSTNTWTVQQIYSLYDDEQGNGTCQSSSQAPYWHPAAIGAGAQVSRPLNVYRNAAQALLPLPATYKTNGRIARKQSHVFRYARKLLADLPHGQVHGQIPSLLREVADVLEREDNKL